ncbi:MAG: hypothetical protein M3460_07445 [Actinomycetota bacterium]|nr:hypothetical protein [Actinomycetota bacterium]
MGRASTFRVRGKNFVFSDQTAEHLSLKLPLAEAEAVVATDDSASPAGYGLERYGWIALTVRPDEDDDRASVGDPSLDFVGLLATFGPGPVNEIIQAYGGKISWRRLLFYWWLNPCYELVYAGPHLDNDPLKLCHAFRILTNHRIGCGRPLRDTDPHERILSFAEQTSRGDGRVYSGVRFALPRGAK